MVQTCLMSDNDRMPSVYSESSRNKT